LVETVGRVGVVLLVAPQEGTRVGLQWGIGLRAKLATFAAGTLGEELAQFFSDRVEHNEYLSIILIMANSGTVVDHFWQNS
jgi:hypothetical protein